MSKRKQSRFGSNVVADVQRRESAASNYGYLKLPKGVNVYKETEGRHKIDIIPYIVSDEHHPDKNEETQDAANVGNPWYKKPIWVHRAIGADNTSLVCPKTMGKKCPICEHRAKQQQQQGVEKDDLVQKPQLRNLYVVIPIGHKEFEEKYHIWNISDGNFQKVLDEELREDPSFGVFPDPEEGFTLEIRFTEEVFNKNKYMVASRIDFKDREAYDQDIMDKAPNLDELVTIMTYAEIEKVFLELDDDDVAKSEEEDDKPRKRKQEDEGTASSFRKRKSVKEETETEEEEDKPAPRKRKAVTEEEEPADPGPSTPRRRKSTEEDVPFVADEDTTPRRRKRAALEEEEEEDDTLTRKRDVKKSKETETEEEEDKPVRGMKRTADTKTKAVKEECPSGHKYGKDWDDHADCDDCKLFDACGKKNESMTK
jgi:hypothetical protein